MAKPKKIVVLKLSPELLRKVKIPENAGPQTPSAQRKAKSVLNEAGAGADSTAAASPDPQKHNPKTSMTAQNAWARALDRSGKPCRRWTRETIALKSFTGRSYTLLSWKGESLPDDKPKEEPAAAKKAPGKLHWKHRLALEHAEAPTDADITSVAASTASVEPSEIGSVEPQSDAPGPPSDAMEVEEVEIKSET